MNAKLIMRDIRTMKTNGVDATHWDEILPEHINSRLVQFFSDMSQVEFISFNRSIKPENTLS